MHAAHQRRAISKAFIFFALWVQSQELPTQGQSRCNEKLQVRTSNSGPLIPAKPTLPQKAVPALATQGRSARFCWMAAQKLASATYQELPRR